MNNDLFKIELFVLHSKKLVWSFKLEVQNQKDFYWIVIRLPKNIAICLFCSVLFCSGFFHVFHFKKNLFIIVYLKVSKFQSEFMKSSFLQKYEPNIVRISALYCATQQGRNFWFIFWERR